MLNNSISLQAKRDKVLVDFAGNTPLHAAAANGGERALQYLLEGDERESVDGFEDIDVNPRNSFKQTPLHLAAEHGHNEYVPYISIIIIHFFTSLLCVHLALKSFSF